MKSSVVKCMYCSCRASEFVSLPLYRKAHNTPITPVLTSMYTVSTSNLSNTKNKSSNGIGEDYQRHLKKEKDGNTFKGYSPLSIFSII